MDQQLTSKHALLFTPFAQFFPMRGLPFIPFSIPDVSYSFSSNSPSFQPEKILPSYISIMVPVTNYQKLGLLKEHRFIILLFWRSEVPTQSQRLKSYQQTVFLLQGLGRIHLLAFSASRCCLHSLAGGPFSIFKANSAASFLSSLTSAFILTFPSCLTLSCLILIRTLGITSITQIMQDDLQSRKLNLIISAKSFSI